MRILVFVGPTLPLTDVRSRLPGAEIRPPARQGDILSAVGMFDPEVIALIDGEFGQSMSVWHKEILFALERGIHVYGASSMGALRAAELDSFGMRGVGSVYEAYASGAIVDDDEVAVAHARHDGDYHLVSEPMVNIRATLEAARAGGALTDAEADELLELAKARFYPDRSLSGLLRDYTSRGRSRREIARVEHALQTYYVDAKRADALQLLDVLQHLPELLPQFKPAFTLTRSASFVGLYDRDRVVRHGEAMVPLASIADYAMLHAPDAHELNQHALNRALVGVLGEMLQVDVTDEEVEDETGRFRLRHRLLSDAALHGWLKENDLFDEDFRDLMREAAVQRKVQRWYITRHHMARTTRRVLNELRHSGRYVATAAAAAGAELLLAERSATLDHIDIEHLPVERLLIEHMRATGARIDTAASAFALDAGFYTVEDLRVELLRMREARALAHAAALRVLDDADAPSVALSCVA